MYLLGQIFGGLLAFYLTFHTLAYVYVNALQNITAWHVKVLFTVAILPGYLFGLVFAFFLGGFIVEQVQEFWHDR